MAAVLSSEDTQSAARAWRGFSAGTWPTRVDVRDFIQSEAEQQIEEDEPRTLLQIDGQTASFAMHSAISLNIECIRHAFINFTATPYHSNRMTSLASLLS